MAPSVQLSLLVLLLAASASWQLTSAQPAPAPAPTSAQPAQAPAPAPAPATASDICSTPSTTVLKANASTVNRGVFSPNFKPAAHIQSGDVIIGECVTQRGTNDYAKFIKGDPGVEDIYFQATGSNQSRSYNAQAGNGGHILTGPVQVCGAKAGDVLKVEILSLEPRKNPATGKCYGANTQGTSGYPAQVTNSTGQNFTDSAIIIFDVVSDESGKWGYPVYQFMVPDKVIGPDGKTGGQIYPHPVNYGIKNANGQFDPVEYPEGYKSSLPNGTAMVYTDAPLNWRIPLRPHLGTMGLAPANALEYGKNASGTILGASSGPPSNFGGNIDNWRIGAGITMYYKVQVDGGLLSFGDCHAAEGDSELSGNAIEASLTGTFRITTLPAATLPAALKNMKAPILEAKDYILIHGFAYNDYITELSKPSDIGKPQFGADLNKAFANTYANTRQFLIDGFGLTERESIAVMSTSVDFGVTQVVDSNWGAHGIINKSVFSKKAPAVGGIPLVGKRKLLDAIFKDSETEYPDMLTLFEETRAGRAREL